MKNYLVITVLALTISLGLSQHVFAVCVEGPPNTFICDTNPPNPDPNGIKQANNDADLTITLLRGAGIDTLLANGGDGGDAIQYGAGSSEIRITNASVFSEDDAINAFQNLGSAEIHIENSTIVTLSDGIDLGNVRSNILNITNSNLRTAGSGARVLNSGQVDDTFNISGSILTAVDASVLTMRAGEDDVTLSNTLLKQSVISVDSAESIRLGEDDDTLTLFNGVVFERPEGGETFINCGEGFDTIVFAMNVPEEFFAEAKARLAEATVPSGAISINGLFYDWTECELLVDELKAGPVGIVRPIPTLSQWGLIATAGVLGVVGLIAVRRKRVAA